MVTLSNQLKEIEAGLSRFQTLVPDLPVLQILTTRTLVLVGRELSNLLDQRLRPHGLSEIEFRTLMQVYSFGTRDAYPSDLCAALSQSPANVTRITDALAERGLISRVPDERDRRRLALKITDKGAALIQTLLPLMISSVRSSYQDFSTQDLTQLLTGLQQLAQAIDGASASIKAQTDGVP